MNSPKISGFLLILSCLQGGDLQCTQGWDFFYNNCYKVVRTSFNAVTYKAAPSLCQTEHPGAIIVMPRSEQEKNYTLDKLPALSDSTWIGLRRFNSTSMWTWQDGTVLNSFDYAAWGNNSPSNITSADCVLTTRAVLGGLWANVLCSTPYIGLICQYDGNNAVHTDSTISLPVSYSALVSPTEHTISHSLTATEESSSTVKTNIDIETSSTELLASFSTQPDSTCKCICSSSNQTTTTLPPTPVFKLNLKTIISDMKVDKDSLSSEIRKRHSSHDPRMSSFYIGCVGITVLVMIVVFILFLDFAPMRHKSIATTKKNIVNVA